MISMLACIFAVARGQEAIERPTPARVSYRIKLYDHSGLLSAPKVRTLDGQAATITQMSNNHELKVLVVPHANSDGDQLSTELEFSLSGSPTVITTLNERSGVASYIKISKARSRNGTTATTIAISPEKPRLGREDYLAVVIGSIQQSPEDDPFTASGPPRQLGAAPPSQILYKIVVTGSSGVISSPVVRTLNNYVARVEAPGKVSIGLLPRLQADGELFSMVDFKMDGDEVARIAVHDKPGASRLYKVWKEDAATAHVEPLASSRQAHLKSGEWLVRVTGTVVNDQP